MTTRASLMVACCAALLSLGVIGFYFFVSKAIMRPSQGELTNRTVSQVFQASKKGSVLSLVINDAESGTYEVGVEFPFQKLPRGKSFDGLLRFEVFENGERVSTREVSGMKRGYLENADSYRAIAMAEFELSITEKVKETKLVASVLRVDSVPEQYQDVKLFVRPVPVK